MATTTTITKMLFRRGNDEDREQTILASGEPGWVLDTKRLWVGDGTTAGGYPIPAVGAENASAGRHLWYVDYELSYNLENKSEPPIIGQGQQFLDVNIPGVANTLAGKTVFPIDGRWFHPARDDITTNFNLVFDNQADGRNDAEIRHTGSGELKIYSSAGGNININDSLFVRGDGSIVFESDTFVIKADKQIFDEGAMTHFEDKSIDFNVVREVDGTNADGSPKYKDLQEGQAGATAEGTGIYFAHENYLSAGHVSVGNKTGYLGWGTIEIQPPVYTFDWEEQVNITGRSQDGSATDGWRTNKSEPESSTGWRPFERKGLGNASGRDSENGDWRAKPLIMHSLRPSSGWENNEYQGFSHLMFESGLLIYDDAGKLNDDDDNRALGVGAPYNAYRMNQSVDTRAAPVFTGIKIRAVDGISDGDPFDIQSGGTGKTQFKKAGIIHTDGAPGAAGDAQYTTSPLQSTPLSLGEIFVGTEAGPTNWAITTNNWLTVRSDVPNHPLRIENKFAPDYLENDELTRKNWFVSFGTITTDEDNLVPVGTNTEPKHTLNTAGDAQTHATNSNLIVDNGHLYVRGDNASSTISFQHRPVGTNLYHHAWDDNKKRGSNEQSPGTESTITYSHNEEDGLKTRTRLVYAGDTDPNLEDAVPTTSLFIDVSGGSEDTHDDITPLTFKNTGYALGALRINREGHIIGIRSKDFDKRYMQNFNVGTLTRKNERINAPSDYTESVNDVANGNIWAETILGYKLDQGELEGSVEWLEAYFNGAAVDSDNISRKVFLDVSGMQNTGHARNSLSYRDVGNPNNNQMNVVTGLEFNDYGTVHSYDTHNLTDIYYDKQQVGWLGLYLDTKMEGLSAAVEDLDYFSRWTDSYTVDTDVGDQPREIRTTWRNNSSIHFTHNSAYATSVAGSQNDDLKGSFIRINPTDSARRDWEFNADSNNKIILRTQPTQNLGLDVRATGNGTDGPENLYSAWSEEKASGDVTLLGTNFELYSNIVFNNQPLFKFNTDKQGESTSWNIDVMREPYNQAESTVDGDRLLFQFLDNTTNGYALTTGEGFDRTSSGGKDHRRSVHIDANVDAAANVWVKNFGDSNDFDSSAATEFDANQWLHLPMVTNPDEHDKNVVSGQVRDGDMKRKLYTHHGKVTRKLYTGTNDVTFNSDTEEYLGGRNGLMYNPKSSTLATQNMTLYQCNYKIGGNAFREGGALTVQGVMTVGNEELIDQHTVNGKVTFNCDYGAADNDADDNDDPKDGLLINGNVTIASDPTTAKTGYRLTVPEVNAVDVDISSSLDLASGATITFGNQTQAAIVLTQNSSSDLTTTSTMKGSGHAGKFLMGGTGGPDFGTIKAKTGAGVADSWLEVNLIDKPNGSGSDIHVAHTGSTPTDWAGTGTHVDLTTGWSKETGTIIDKIVLDDQGHVSRVGTSELTRDTLGIQETAGVKFDKLGVGTSAIPATKGTIWAANDIVAFYGSSDERIKTDVTTIDDALEVIKGMRGVRFKYNDIARQINPGVSEQTQVGVIAQEAEKVLPEVMRPVGLMPGIDPANRSENDDGEVKGVRYENITAVLIEAVKQLSAKVEDLENKLAAK